VYEITTGLTALEALGHPQRCRLCFVDLSLAMLVAIQGPAHKINAPGNLAMP
jgi:hypothetical protein